MSWLFGEFIDWLVVKFVVVFGWFGSWLVVWLIGSCVDIFF